MFLQILLFNIAFVLYVWFLLSCLYFTIYSYFEYLLKELATPVTPEALPQPEVTTKHEEVIPQKTAITPLKGNCEWE